MMGWRGPRGLASVVFTLIAYEAFHETNRSSDVLFAVAGWTILMSVLLHGFSALPLANWYAKRIKGATEMIPEMMVAPELEQCQQRFTDRYQITD